MGNVKRGESNVTFPNPKPLSKMTLQELDQEIDLRVSEGLWGGSTPYIER